eukprot:226955-Chlamydomonas_euryale.AAC.1
MEQPGRQWGHGRRRMERPRQSNSRALRGEPGRLPAKGGRLPLGSSRGREPGTRCPRDTGVMLW